MSFGNNSGNRDISVKHSAPIAIQPTGFRRPRSASVSSASSSSFSSQSEILTPISPNGTSRLSLPSPANATSPILSYFLSQTPSKTPASAAFPFKRNFGPPPVFEEEGEMEIPVTGHTRRASSAVAGRFSTQQQNVPLTDANTERGTNLLRRLSLSSAFVQPQFGSQRSGSPPTPPNSAVSPTAGAALGSPGRKTRRAATIGVGSERRRRAPSPMGERILKGHFDGFN